jgi:GMP synthase (glutamine-hydrolysing)
MRVTRAAAQDPVFSLCPPQFLALQWHADTYELPAGAVQLARSERYQQQAFVAGRAYAMQFHIEVSAALAGEWGQLPAYANSLETNPRRRRAGSAARTSGGARARNDRTRSQLFAAWLQHVVGLTAPPPTPTPDESRFGSQT